MSSPAPHSLTIPPEFEAEMALAVRAVVEMLLDRVAKLEARVEELKNPVGRRRRSPHCRRARSIRTLGHLGC